MGVDKIGEVGDRASEGEAAGVYGAGFTVESLARWIDYNLYFLNNIQMLYLNYYLIIEILIQVQHDLLKRSTILHFVLQCS